MLSLDKARKIAQVLDNKKAMDTKIICIKDISVLADYFVIATGTGNTHVSALADEAEFQLKQEGVSPARIEGHRSNSWILRDYETVIVHIFSPEAREFYGLDRLWQGGEEISL